MAADDQGNDLSAVGVPITGLVAYAPAVAGSVISKATLGASPLVLPAGAQKLGLIKTDGGPADTRDSGDSIEFFQKGYALPGDGTRSVQVTLAQQDDTVQSLVEGVAADANGVREVASNLPGNRFVLYVITKFRNGTEYRREGVAYISAIEGDQEERGSVKGQKVTFVWAEDALFNGAPFWAWGPAIPGASAKKTSWAVTVTGSPTGGTFALKLNGYSTPNLAYNAAAADIQAALNGLSGVTGISGITVSGTAPGRSRSRCRPQP